MNKKINEIQNKLNKSDFEKLEGLCFAYEIKKSMGWDVQPTLNKIRELFKKYDIKYIDDLL